MSTVMSFENATILMKDRGFREKVMPLFQSLFDKEMALREGTPDIRTRMVQFTNWAQKEIAPKIEKLIFDTFNHKVSLVFYPELGAFHAMASVGFKDPSRKESLPDSGYRPMMGTATKTVANVADKIAAKFNWTTWEMPKEAADFIIAKIDIGYSFFCLDALSKGKHENFTPVEVADIFAHELGHAITLPLFMSYWYYRSTELRSSIQYISENMKPEDIPVIIEKAVEMAEEVGTSEVKKAGGLLISFLRIADSLPLFMAGVILWAFAFIASARISKMMTPLLVTGTRSDVVRTAREVVEPERAADEFAAHLGMASGVVTGLLKLRGIGMGLNPEELRNARNLPAVRKAFVWLKVASTNFSVGGWGSGYDGEIDRYEWVVKNLTARLKDQKLDPKLRDHLINEITSTLQAINDLKNVPGFKTSTFINEKLLGWLSLKSFGNAITTGNLADTYQGLQRLTSGLLKTPLYWEAARLAQKIENSKYS